MPFYDPSDMIFQILCYYGFALDTWVLDAETYTMLVKLQDAFHSSLHCPPSQRQYLLEG